MGSAKRDSRPEVSGSKGSRSDVRLKVGDNAVCPPHGVGEVVGPVCGDVITVYIKASGGVIQDASFTTYGSGQPLP